MGAASAASASFSPTSVIAGSLNAGARRMWNALGDAFFGGQDLLKHMANTVAPAVTRANRRVGEALAHLGASRVMGEVKARTQTQWVRGEASDEEVDRAFAYMLEDQLRTLRRNFEELRDEAASKGDQDKATQYDDLAKGVISIVGGPQFKTEADYLADPSPVEREVIDRHLQDAQPDLERLFVEAGGETNDALKGERFGGFFHFVAGLDSKGNPIEEPIIAQPARESLRWGVIRKTPLAYHQRRGTAKNYTTDPALIYRTCYVTQQRIANLRTFVKQCVNRGVGVLAPDKKARMSPDGKALAPIQVRLGTIVTDQGTFPKDAYLHVPVGMVHREIAAQLNPRSPARVPVLTPILNFIQNWQMFGIGDASWHTALVAQGLMQNMVGTRPVARVALESAIGGPLYLLGDAAVRAAAWAVRRAHEDPRALEAESRLASMGAMRELGAHKAVGNSLFGRGWDKVIGRISRGTSWWINTTDFGSRAASLALADAAAKAKIIPDTETARRELVNNAGQYLRDNQGLITRALGESGVQRFIVASKTALRLLLQQSGAVPMIEGGRFRQNVAMRGKLLVNLIGMMLNIGLLSYLLSGKFGGRTGTPSGSIDTGLTDKQGRPVTIPIMLLAPGKEIFSLAAPAIDAARFNREVELHGGKKISWRMVRDQVVDKLVHRLTRPLVGTGVEAGFKAVTGRVPTPVLQKTTPPVPPGTDERATRAEAAAAQINPTLSRLGAWGLRKAGMPKTASRVEQLVSAGEPQNRYSGAQQLGPFSTAPGRTAKEVKSLPQRVMQAQLGEYEDDAARMIRNGTTYAERFRLLREATAAIDDPSPMVRIQLRARFMEEMKRRGVLRGER
jgi:hypothetical protein